MAVIASSSRRVDYLAKPKPIPSGFLEDKRSVYWIDRNPPELGSASKYKIMPRLDDLSRPRACHPEYLEPRPTPIWQVSDSAKTASASARLASLAAARPFHSQYREERSVYTIVSGSAKSFRGSARLEQLCNPKPHKIWSSSEDNYMTGDFGEAITRVVPAALSANVSARVTDLAAPKQPPPEYQGERTVRWPVSDGALTVQASLRLQQLARPKSGRMKKDDYDPYKVSVACRNARPSPRVTDLAMPMPRKVREKKGG